MAKSIVDSFREVAQNILVPELKAVRVSMDGLRTEMLLRDDRLADAVEARRVEVRLRDERAQESIRHLDERTQQSIKALDDRAAALIAQTQQSITSLDDRTHSSLEKLSPRLDIAIDIRERLVDCRKVNITICGSV